MNRDRIQAAIKSLEQHAVTEDEMHLINYLKINLGNLWHLEDDEDLEVEDETRDSN
jgi:hypothetical protein